MAECAEWKDDKVQLTNGLRRILINGWIEKIILNMNIDGWTDVWTTAISHLVHKRCLRNVSSLIVYQFEFLVIWRKIFRRQNQSNRDEENKLESGLYIINVQPLISRVQSHAVTLTTNQYAMQFSSKCELIASFFSFFFFFFSFFSFFLLFITYWTVSSILWLVERYILTTDVHVCIRAHL